MKESRKDVLPGAEGPASPGEAHAGGLARCTELAQSQVSLQSASSVGSARGDEGATYADVCGDYRPLFDNLQDPDNVSLQGGGRPGGAGRGPCGGRGASCSAPTPCAEAEAEALSRVGQGSRKLEGWWLKVRQFHGLLVKRFHCARRNSKALSSQILLPAFFVCVAMTVALSVPEIGRAAGPGRGTWGPASHSGGTGSSPLLNHPLWAWTLCPRPAGVLRGLSGAQASLGPRPQAWTLRVLGKRDLGLGAASRQ